jgi:hypothetical protein
MANEREDGGFENRAEKRAGGQLFQYPQRRFPLGVRAVQTFSHGEQQDDITMVVAQAGADT